MKPNTFAFFVLLAIGTGSRLFAQTYDQLRQENQILRARIAALSPADVNSHTPAPHHDHPPHNDHSHEGPTQNQQHSHNDQHSHNEQHAHQHEQHSHNDQHARQHRCQECETHFDYCCPFEDHHGGHGHCELCGCAHRHGANGPGANGPGPNSHAEHGHQHGPAYHHSIEGYPLLHAARAEFFFIERHLHFRLADTHGADDGAVDELEFEAEILYALNDRVALIATAPFVSIDPIGGDRTSGFGDLEFGFRFLAFNGTRDGVFFGLDVTAPTGDDDRDLGAGHTVLAPVASWVHDFGCGAYMFNTVAWEVPVDIEEVENTFRYDLALLHTFVETADWSCCRYLTPSFEVNTETALNGPESGRMVVDFTLGLTWVVREEDEIALGWSFPVSGDRNFDNQFLVNYIRHF